MCQTKYFRFSASLQSQSSKQRSGEQRQFLAVLEADMKLYELALDHSDPDNLNVNFLQDFNQLPTSYLDIDAPAKFQEFILRYGNFSILR